MPTIRQKKLAKVIVENAKLDKPLNAGEMLVKVGYSKNVAEAKPTEIINSEGVQQALSDLGFTESNAAKVVHSIMMDDKVDPSTRLKATDQVFKVVGSYVSDKMDKSTNNVFNFVGININPPNGQNITDKSD